MIRGIRVFGFFLVRANMVFSFFWQLKKENNNGSKTWGSF